ASLWVAPGAKTGAIPSEHRARIGASGTLRFAHRGIMELNGQAPRWTTLTDRAQVTSPNPVGSRLLLGLRLRCRQRGRQRADLEDRRWPLDGQGDPLFGDVPHDVFREVVVGESDADADRLSDMDPAELAGIHHHAQTGSELGRDKDWDAPDAVGLADGRIGLGEVAVLRVLDPAYRAPGGRVEDAQVRLGQAGTDPQLGDGLLDVVDRGGVAD